MPTDHEQTFQSAVRTEWTGAGRDYVDGCDECNRSDSKPWPIFTVNYHGVEVCAKCLQPMEQLAVDRLYVKVFMTGTTHLASFENESSVASFCGRSWPHGNVGTSRERPRGPLCFVCRRAEARHLRDD